MKSFIVVAFILGMIVPKSWCQPFGYSYAKEITIPTSQVSGGADLTDFPVLIWITSDANLETTANGGHVTSNNGYDIIFTSSDCLTQLDHQIEAYAPTTGGYRAWVRIPILSASSNTVIHMYYGNSSVTTNPSTTGVWDVNYRGVWHFQGNVNDNSSNGSNLTNNATSNTNAGKIGSARNLNNNPNILSSDNDGEYLELPDNFFAGMTNFTFEGWVRLDRSATNWERIFDFGQNTTANFFFCPSTGTGGPAPTVARITTGGNGSEQGPVSGNVTNTGSSFNHWAVVLNNAASTMTIYKNGAALATANGVTLTPQSIESSTANYFGRSQYAADHYIDAIFDEFRISNNARTAGWIATSYNNQNTPSSFYTVSAEAAAATLCSPLPINLRSFKATVHGDVVDLDWSTSTEVNNDYFTIERASPSLQWESIGSYPGAGNSVVERYYSYTDKSPLAGRSYYRLRQTDFDGTQTVSDLVTVYRDEPSETGFSVSWDDEYLTVRLNSSLEGGIVSVYTIQGQLIVQSQVNDIGQYPITLLKPGAYIVTTRKGTRFYSKKVFIH